MKNNSSSLAIGQQGEDYVADVLTRQGYQLLARNFTSPYGEIDIIAAAKDAICFVEVKTRRLESQVSGEAAVTRQKQRRIITTALLYLQEYPTTKGMRFDVAVVTRDVTGNIVNHEYYPAAFDGTAYERE